MLNKSCPGAIALKEPVPEDISCAGCGQEIEIWSDEVRVRCPHCGTLNTREVPPSCIEWCSAALECVGPEIYEQVTGTRPSLDAASSPQSGRAPWPTKPIQ